ncbi:MULTISPECIES: shikimate dehydrogenase [unclassified Undibacterium]|uniref:shikimate dehydrogenase family protein n=1 Tax=unclassified Undibacterium TaxID=2630295 RepID=UPI002AC956E9|nr:MULTISPECIES: shikimate dehydrogenase [unclassified Undibacterium]MEB0138440.1 shikimate dehydrogenase [Undibacterium sp. CCC2.1]MEB0171315.1 shikimate dehydrogenase [Undibacterium sp. CCC1.1]MEB0176448.1 shikimate dehydrogenase [Undibacterium sp. CCC3.4]MEB0214069.1 shikimate dehydrogenase [Undibacterium sp. 5I2]WPX43681.1 shikimate dehydrogenase [Undibacterium sp. CCC3.4]
MSAISGTTRIFFVIGWPVEQVKAPALFNAYFEQHGLDARVIPLKVAPDAYTATVRQLMTIENVGGIFVSIPHKPMTVSSVDIVTERAQMAGACNAIYRDLQGRIVGDLIDGEGFVRGLDRTCAAQPFDWAQARALVVGSGGVGCAIAASLAARGIAEIGVYDTRTEQAEALQQRLQLAFPATAVSVVAPQARGYDLIVNSTPLGMHVDDPLPLDLTGLSAECIVADCGMKIEMTKLLTAAAARGCRIQKGREMLIEQAPLYLELFGWPDVDAAAFRALGTL